MGNIIKVLARVEVEDLPSAVETYRALTGGTPARLFSFGSIELAWVDPFLLLSGPIDELQRVRRVATVLVGDIAVAAQAVASLGGQVLEGPGAGPNGTRMIARHPDGALFEYVETLMA
ncbi:VOC family protein [Quadrisphaera oryzae]|uniref:VOC family protein n=1 Tax=Quadrisphaera TaxID=317661 RepID=UPI00164837FC|nr:hypothetical protein [Quadrisphaera sp. RL12-1S]MBC3761453.1 hypothetical protein [Quadrisphaera sp. RL12-1S]